LSGAIHVAILGFSAFERNALASHFRIAQDRHPSYDTVLDIDDARFVIADADQGGVAELLRELGRTDDAVFVGASAPPEAAAWMMRPIDPAYVMRELDRLLQARESPNSQPIPIGLPSTPAPVRAPKSPAGAAPARRADDPTPIEADPLVPGAPARRWRRRLAAAEVPLRRALLVDDSEIALVLLRRLLEPYGLASDLAYDSAEAIQQLAAQAYGIVFLDVELGEGSELDGLALCQRIKTRQLALNGKPPLVVLVSAHHDAVHQVRGTLAGADAYLAKPLDRAALDRLLTRVGLAAVDSGSG
jgi:CheY-like chemotaxis protein